eukprot:TRINITY_DN32493_c0_g1_i1.p1 TRINITY_DN32493_c0_g1~~TRINITY_DN32493_c0_g1_i1.p1  ORF type:complete len:822 (+),score=159.27 TRINITY_DN32493_c0_g1_i1:83-2548(+)
MPKGSRGENGEVSPPDRLQYRRFNPARPQAIPQVSRRAVLDGVLTANGKPLRSGLGRLLKTRAAGQMLCDMYWWVYLRFFIGLETAKGRQRSADRSLRRSIERLKAVTKVTLGMKKVAAMSTPAKSANPDTAPEASLPAAAAGPRPTSSSKSREPTRDWADRLPWHIYPERAAASKRGLALMSKTVAPGTVQHGLSVEAICVPAAGKAMNGGSPTLSASSTRSRSMSPLSSMSNSSERTLLGTPRQASPQRALDLSPAGDGERVLRRHEVIEARRASLTKEPLASPPPEGLSADSWHLSPRRRTSLLHQQVLSASPSGVSPASPEGFDSVMAKHGAGWFSTDAGCGGGKGGRRVTVQEESLLDVPPDAAISNVRFVAAPVEEQEDFVETEEQDLFDRVARNYMRVLRAICRRRERAVADLYHALLPDLLAQAVCAAIHRTVPQASLFADDISKETYGFLTYWFLGVQRTSVAHWPDNQKLLEAAATAASRASRSSVRSNKSSLRLPPSTLGPAPGEPAPATPQVPRPRKGKITSPQVVPTSTRRTPHPPPKTTNAARRTPRTPAQSSTLNGSAGTGSQGPSPPGTNMTEPRPPPAAATGLSLATAFKMKRLATGLGKRIGARSGSTRPGVPPTAEEADAQAARELNELNQALNAVRSGRHRGTARNVERERSHSIEFMKSPADDASASLSGAPPASARGTTEALPSPSTQRRSPAAPRPMHEGNPEENERGYVRLHGTVRKLRPIKQDIKERMAAYADGPAELPWFEKGRSGARRSIKRVAVGNFCYTDFSPIMQHVYHRSCLEQHVSRPADMHWSVNPNV